MLLLHFIQARLSGHHVGFPSSGAAPLQRALTQNTSKGLNVCETKSSRRPSWGLGRAQISFPQPGIYFKVCSAQRVKSVESVQKEVLFSAKIGGFFFFQEHV